MTSSQGSLPRHFRRKPRSTPRPMPGRRSDAESFIFPTRPNASKTEGMFCFFWEKVKGGYFVRMAGGLPYPAAHEKSNEESFRGSHIRRTIAQLDGFRRIFEQLGLVAVLVLCPHVSCARNTGYVLRIFQSRWFVWRFQSFLKLLAIRGVSVSDLQRLSKACGGEAALTPVLCRCEELDDEPSTSVC